MKSLNPELLNFDMYISFSTVPSAPPKEITAVDQTLFSITISWQPVHCRHQNGKITGYIIKYQEIDSEEMMVRGIMGNNFTVTGLKSLTTYLIQVAANNTVGMGVFGNISASTLLCKLSSIKLCGTHCTRILLYS